MTTGPELFARLTAGAPDAPALVSTETVAFGRLPARTDGWARALESGRKALVVCFAGRTLDTVLCWLAVQRLGHAVAMLDAGAAPAARDRFLAAYEPDFVAWCSDASTEPPPPPAGYRPHATVGTGTVWRREADPGVEPHPDLALVLSTSGSTGNPKAVRLSYRNVEANSESVAASLGVSEVDRAATALPLHFGYGLSVVTSHLIAGASAATISARPSSRGFWRAFAAAGCTNFPGVAPTYAMLWPMVSVLDRVPTLRSMTCSGSRLRDDLVLSFHDTLARRGGRLFMMYGQTESTSRMTCLDPACLPERVGSVGTPIPGGSVSIAADGEIVYRGPNVMLGYAEHRADLARGDETGGVLHTGDLGRIDDGFLHLTGRLKRIVKLLGLRVSLDDVERLFEDAATVAAVDAGDGVVVWTDGPVGTVEKARHSVATELGVPASLLTIRSVPELPRTPNGKLDYRSLPGD
jgi:acyl-CoA synthetase (AMP-forming)/AMP-acid ligase II